MKRISIGRLRELLVHNPVTGELFWLPRAPEMFAPKGRRSASGCANGWNAKFAGKQAFKSRTARGYFQGEIIYGSYSAHRVVWALHYGQWPDGEIDHIDGNGQNNCIDNLRCVSRIENCQNQKIRNTNTSGIMGVHWNKQNSKWSARICHDNKDYHLGLFASKQDAISARKAAETEFGFHQNHGRAA